MKLRRTAIGNLELSDLEPAAWRYLTGKEVRELFAYVEEKARQAGGKRTVAVGEVEAAQARLEKVDHPEYAAEKKVAEMRMKDYPSSWSLPQKRTRYAAEVKAIEKEREERDRAAGRRVLDDLLKAKGSTYGEVSTAYSGADAAGSARLHGYEQELYTSLERERDVQPTRVAA